MTAYLFLPLRFVVFWFIEAPIALLRYFFAWNISLMYYLSIPLFLRTFFKPLKNEYRAGLVGFSIAMGIVMKTVLLMFSLLFFGIIAVTELVITISFVLIPVGTVALLFL